MSISPSTKEVAAYNERSLQKLAWAIEASPGEFSLILAHCNYTYVQRQMMQRLREICSLQIREVVLKKFDRRLYQKIRQELGDERPGVVLVFGLESVDDIDGLLVATNQVREEFRKNFHCPLVLWINNEIQTKLIRVAPDFESWGTTREFQIPPDSLSYELIYILSQSANEIFTEFPTTEPEKFLYELNLGIDNLSGIESAWEDLQSHDNELEPELEASFYFMKGRNHYAVKQFNQSLICYQKSLKVWKRTTRLDWQVMLIIHIGLCASGTIEKHNLFQEYIDNLARNYPLDLVNKFLPQFANTLQQLHRWADLENLAKKFLILHEKNAYSIELVQDYGFLAEVALTKTAWTEAKRFAEKALSILKRILSAEPTGLSPEQKTKMEGMQSFYRGWFLLLLARAEKGLANYQGSLNYLEKAKAETQLHSAPELYIRILENLREIYFQQENYLAAFKAKQEKISIEQQVSLRAFVGAGILQPKQRKAKSQLSAIEPSEMVADEIIASGRQRDINNLLEKIGQTDVKLTIIHGQSGVGKSSLIYAGLVPILKQRAIGQRDVMPIAIRVYTDWVGELGKLLVNAREARGLRLTLKPDSVASILQQLKENEKLNFLTVLIFDQFEEFFFSVKNIKERNLFFKFLKKCLDELRQTKVILSLNEDYLHYLLQFERSIELETIDDILDRKNRYFLGKLSKQESCDFITKITNKARFYLEPNLTHQLVNDLIGEVEEVHPIELQILGYQLQTENIKTLAQYQQIGSYHNLLMRFLKEVIADCGPENQSIAQNILYALTNENNTRPLKTKTDLLSQLGLKAETLDLVLGILVSSGLVLLLPQHPAHYYQLAQNYLVKFIRKQQRSELLAELEQEREERKGVEVNRRNLKQRSRNLFLITVLTTALLGVVSLFGGYESKNNKIIALTKSSEISYRQNRELLEPLIEALRAGKQLNSAILPKPDTQSQTLAALQQAIYGVRERNRLQGYDSWVNSISFSPDGEILATGSADGTVRLWLRDGTLLDTLQGHADTVNSISFSPDGEILTTGSADGTVRLWLRDGTLLDTLQGHADTVNSVSFSPDGEIFATGSADGTVRLWLRDGTLLHTLQGHTDTVNSVSFSPDGALIVSGSRDGTVKFWDRKGNPIDRTFPVQEAGVTSFSFSPDGQTLVIARLNGSVTLWNLQSQESLDLLSSGATIGSVRFSPDSRIIATGSLDGTVKLWSREGQEFQILRGHNKGITSIRFSPDSKILATAGEDLTVRLWSVEGYNLETQTLFGHNAAVDSVSFSPDGQTLATASVDGTVRLWKGDGTLLMTLVGHEGAVISVSFSPDSQTLATASVDGTVRLWKGDGTLLDTLVGHEGAVISVSFSPDGQTLATASVDGTVRLWKGDGTLLMTLVGHEDDVYSVKFSPDGKILASASKDGTIKLWNLQGEELATLLGHSGAVNSVSFSPDARTIATGSFDGTIKLWNLQGEELATLLEHSSAVNLGHSGAVNSLSFSPNGQTLASGSSDGTVKLWSRDGQLLQTLQRSGAAINSVSFSPDGKTLATASEDKTVMLWNINPTLDNLDELLRRGCDWAGDYLKNNPNVNESDRTLCEDTALAPVSLSNLTQAPSSRNSTHSHG